jgi:hypothetical protein
MQPPSFVQGCPFCALPQLPLAKSHEPPFWHMVALSQL